MKLAYRNRAILAIVIGIILVGAGVLIWAYQTGRIGAKADIAYNDIGPIWRLATGTNPNYDHFYTMNDSERDNAYHNLGYDREGEDSIIGYAYKTAHPEFGTDEIFRLYKGDAVFNGKNYTYVDHFYTMNGSGTNNDRDLFMSPCNIPGVTFFDDLLLSWKCGYDGTDGKDHGQVDSQGNGLLGWGFKHNPGHDPNLTPVYCLRQKIFQDSNGTYQTQYLDHFYTTSESEQLQVLEGNNSIWERCGAGDGQGEGEGNGIMGYVFKEKPTPPPGGNGGAPTWSGGDTSNGAGIIDAATTDDSDQGPNANIPCNTLKIRRTASIEGAEKYEATIWPGDRAHNKPEPTNQHTVDITSGEATIIASDGYAFLYDGPYWIRITAIKGGSVLGTTVQRWFDTNRIVKRCSTPPIGSFDGIDPQEITYRLVPTPTVHLNGWACDANSYTVPVTVDFYVDVQDEKHRFQTVAKNDRPDLPCNGTTAHGFSYALDMNDLIKMGGSGSHTIYAYAQDDQGLSHNLIGQKQLTAYSTSKGWLDTVDSSRFKGWACDSDDFNQPQRVDFYADGSAGSGTWLGSTVDSNTTLANKPRTEEGFGDQCGNNINHGFEFPTPNIIKDGKEHKIYAYAVGFDGVDNPLLSGSPRTANFAVSTNPPSTPQSTVTVTQTVPGPTTTATTTATVTSTATTTATTTSTATVTQTVTAPPTPAPPIITPDAPANAQISITSDGDIKVTWDPAAGKDILGYIVYDAVTNTPLYLIARDDKDNLPTEYLIKRKVGEMLMLLCNQEYSYYVRALGSTMFKADGSLNVSEPSNTVKIKTSACANANDVQQDKDIRLAIATKPESQVGKLISTGTALWFNILIALVISGIVAYFLLRKPKEE